MDLELARRQHVRTVVVKVVVYPADRHGCGYIRLIWPSEVLRRDEHDVTVVEPHQRHLKMVVDDRTNEIVDVDLPDDVDVVVLQRVTHAYVAQAIHVLRARGVTVVVDVDDDLTTIHPDNPAWDALRPNRDRRYVATTGKPYLHSWHNLTEACREATFVTTTTPALLRRYAAHGRGRVLPNYLAAHYYDVPHDDSTVLGWPAALRSHPNDPEAVGNAVARLVQDGYRFRALASSPNVGRAFGLTGDGAVETLSRPVELLDWPRAVAELGVGIAPLADTRFNEAKSWLKPLELAAVGVPWVASPRADYRRLNALGCGVLVDRPKDWYRALRGLLTNERRRAELSDAGRAVATTLRLDDHAWRWWEAWSDALAIQRDGAAA